jgi:hypothetical protein
MVFSLPADNQGTRESQSIKVLLHGGITNERAEM